MNDKIFIDTNILIYAYSADEPLKSVLIQTILAKHETIVISTQVINEFINVMAKKRKVPINNITKAIKELIQAFSIDNVNIVTIELALFLSDKYKYSYFDSLILASALSTQCTIVYSEDMHNGQIIEHSLKIINPFTNI